MTRKIIQICVAPGYKIETHLGGFKSPGGVVALCDDGSLWRLPDGNEKYADSWFRLADIPQPEPRDANWVEKEVARILRQENEKAEPDQLPDRPGGEE